MSTYTIVVVYGFASEDAYVVLLVAADWRVCCVS